jgi:ketol-acid reductoisomerase
MKTYQAAIIGLICIGAGVAIGAYTLPNSSKRDAETRLDLLREQDAVMLGMSEALNECKDVLKKKGVKFNH